MNLFKGVDFFQFLGLFFRRIILIFQPDQLLEDEVQIYTLITIGVACILVSIFILLQKKMMIANSISHTILLGIIAFLFSVRFFFGSEIVFTSKITFDQLILPAFFSAVFTYAFTDFLIHRLKVQEDASIGIVFTFLFALSIFFVSMMGRNSHLGVEAIMGNIDAIHLQDLKVSFFCMGMILLTILILFPYYKWMSFDFAYSKVMGMKVNILNLILIFLCSITLIVGFKSVGVVMILALMTFPVLTARLFFHSIVPLLLSAIGINSFASILAVALSRSFLSVYQLSISTSGLLVTILAMLFFLGLAINKKLTKRFAKRIRQQVS